MKEELGEEMCLACDVLRVLEDVFREGSLA